MAKHSDPSELPRAELPRAEPPRAERAPGASSFVVTFAGQAPITVQAGSPEEAAKVAAEQLGVVRSETKPDVVPANG